MQRRTRGGAGRRDKGLDSEFLVFGLFCYEIGMVD